MRRTKACKVCGKEYTVCKNETTYDGVFRWRVVACSPECGAEYLAAVTAARSGKPVESTSITKEEIVKPAKKAKKVELVEITFDGEELSEKAEEDFAEAEEV